MRGEELGVQKELGVAGNVEEDQGRVTPNGVQEKWAGQYFVRYFQGMVRNWRLFGMQWQATLQLLCGEEVAEGTRWQQGVIRKVIAVVQAVSAGGSVGQWRWENGAHQQGLVMELDELGEEKERIKSDPKFLL